ncbi:MAG: pyrroline-5-carboxylate reductase, partial [Frankiaceae bacterium]|nr:pyrroline-5-carboxylate reductase [Frankiaceae bacterium]
MTEKVAILGAGKMGEALMSGLLRAGRPPADLLFSERHPDRTALLTERYGVRGVATASAAQSADTLLVAVKPQEMGALLDELAGVVPAETLVITIAAGIPTAFLESRLAPGTPVVRVMSNTPVFVDEAMSAVAAGAHATEEHLARTETLLAPVGKVIRVP